MKKQLLWCMAALSFSAASAQTYETRFARPLSDVLNDVAARFQVRLKYDVDTVGRVLPYADFRIRPYSLEETLTNVLSPFDYKFVKQSDKVYKLKPYEYARRTDADGEKMLAYLSGLYSDKSQWEQRREILRKEVRQRLGLDDMLGKTVKDAKPVLSKIRKFDGYTVQNFALETLMQSLFFLKYANLMAIPCRTLHWKPCRGFMSAVQSMPPAPKANMH